MNSGSHKSVHTAVDLMVLSWRREFLVSMSVPDTTSSLKPSLWPVGPHAWPIVLHGPLPHSRGASFALRLEAVLLSRFMLLLVTWVRSLGVCVFQELVHLIKAVKFVVIESFLISLHCL